MTPRQKLGKRLRRMRLAAGLTQDRVGELMRFGSGGQYVSNWERGLSRPPLTALSRLGEAFGIEPVQLAEVMFEAEMEELKERRTRVLKELRS